MVRVQRDLDRYIAHRRRRRRALTLTLILLLFAILALGMRACSGQFREPLNKTYVPLDQLPPHLQGK